MRHLQESGVIFFKFFLFYHLENERSDRVKIRNGAPENVPFFFVEIDAVDRVVIDAVDKLCVRLIFKDMQA